MTVYTSVACVQSSIQTYVKKRKPHCKYFKTQYISSVLNPVALRMARTLWSFGDSECNRVKILKCCISADEVAPVLFRAQDKKG